MMGKITYTNGGSQTTTAIAHAPHSIRMLWDKLHTEGINIARVRSGKERFGTTTGRTFMGFHFKKVSAYQQLDEPIKELYFTKKLKLGKANTGMQVLEIPNNIDVQETLQSLDKIVYYKNTSVLGRVWQGIKSLFA